MTKLEHFNILLKKGYNKQDLLKLDEWKEFAGKPKAEPKAELKAKKDGKTDS